MKHKIFLLGLIIVFAAEILVLVWFMNQSQESRQDAVEINEAVQSVRRDWGEIGKHRNDTGLDYTVLDGDGTVIFRTKEGLSENINEAVIHRDIILDIEIDGLSAGKIIIYSDSEERFETARRKITFFLLTAMIIQCALCVIYLVYLNRAVIKPFGKLKGFAGSVAGGNLDIPLEMDRQNIFGAFTESFDIMRSELKKARIAEARANESKKELVAKLSHDIRTPVASIKAAAEVGEAIAENEKTCDSYMHIIRKADQINTLVTNLFSATLEELQRLTVEPADMNGGELYGMLESADYFHYAGIPEIPQCLVFADKLRLQQVFDNIFANSYKYANTKIDVNVTLLTAENRLAVRIEDYGGGVPEEELPLLKEKFKRGSNSRNIEGAGLGLYISDGFMREMNGGLDIENGVNGLAVTVFISLSGNSRSVQDASRES